MFDQPVLRKFGLVTSILVAVCLLVIRQISFSNDQSASLLVEAMIFLPLVWFFMAATHRKILRDFFRDDWGPFRWQDLAGIFVALFLVSNGLDYLMSMAIGQIDATYVEASLSMEVIDPILPPWQNMAGFFLAVFAAPIIEEIVFRGLIFSRLAQRFGPTAGVLISSALFGLIHFDGFLGSFLFALIMCLIYWHTRNLWLPIGLHVLNNALAVGWMYWDGTDPVSYHSIQQYWPYYMSCLLAMPAVFIFIKRFWPSRKEDLS